jgi:Helitron helicase-like domain at N-terminus/PIF1-like helicase
MFMNIDSTLETKSKIKSVPTAIRQADSRFENLLDLNVCLICDTFLNPSYAIYISVDTLLDTKFRQYLQRARSVEYESEGEIRFESIPAAVAAYYTYRGNVFGRSVTTAEKREIKAMLLSPRGKFVQNATVIRRGFMICKSCHYGVKHKCMPKFAIANNFYFGTPPQCLLDLTEVELALLTPMRTYGYMFSYTGGKQRKLSGTLVYFKIDLKKVKESIVQLDLPALVQNVVVLIHGNLTVDQAKRAYARSKVNPERLLMALKWLIENNHEWRGESFAQIKAGILNRTLAPEIVDRFREETDSEEQSLERCEEDRESFDVFYPDGTTINTKGKTADIEKFQSLLQRAKTDGYVLALRKNQSIGERSSEFNNNNLVNSCLLQFPYGLGGLRAKRYKGDLSTGVMNIHEYTRHLDSIAQPHFHSGMFCLVLYNLYIKHRMLLSASFSVRGNVGAETMMRNITVADVEKAVENRKRGDTTAGSSAAVQYLSAVDSISRDVPHTDEAAKRARGIAEAHMHHFGLPTFFITACPDDDNSVVIQIMAQEIIDTDEPIAKLSDETLQRRAAQKTALRLKYPGICARYFHEAIEIIFLDVIGWDIRKQKKTSANGIFGETIAVAGCVEEQGRGTLHLHLQLWVKEFISAADRLHSKITQVAKDSKDLIERTMDKLASAQLFDRKLCPQVSGNYGLFDHEVRVNEKCDTVEPPEVVSDQELRHLRHIRGQVSSCHVFARCRNCKRTWTNLQLVERFMKHICRKYKLSDYPDTSKRLKAIVAQHQKGNVTAKAELSILPCIIDASYNHHVHTSSCFMCKARKANHKNEKATKKRTQAKHDRKGEECRYRFPTCPSPYTRIRNLSDSQIPWYSWNGTFELRQIKELVLKRQRYDSFQNSCCRAISHSKLSCNSNLQFVTPGPILLYVFYYVFKPTQDDETSKFDNVVESFRKKFNALQKEEAERGESNTVSARSLAVKIVLSGSYAHQKENVVSAAMASHLLRYESRFIFSHTVVWCPLHDLELVLTNKKSFTTLRHANQRPFYNNAAMHYLCRPQELDDVCVFDFFSKYDVVTRRSKNRNTQIEQYEFVNGHFQHPSYQEDSTTMLQCIVKRQTEVLIRIQQYQFPDTSSFRGNILDPETVCTDSTEQYAKLVLLLFLPFRSYGQLTQCENFTKTFRMFATSSAFTNRARSWLQNVQDCRGNCFRLSQVEDELQQKTTCFEDNSNLASNTPEKDENLSDGDSVSDDALNDTLQRLEMFSQSAEPDINGQELNNGISLPKYNIATLRDKGTMKCGYAGLVGAQLPKHVNELWEATTETTAGGLEDVENEFAQGRCKNQNPSHRELATLLLLRVNQKERTFGNISQFLASVHVLEANGSTQSIIDWGRKANLDKDQQRAFEIFTATFILTFYFNNVDGDDLSSSPKILREEYDRLLLLSGASQRKSKQLICLMHGPGGSGKTTVIDLLLTYARDFCSYLGGYDVDADRLIVVTAMSGVAATHIMGETTHGAIHLNRKAAFKEEHYERWRNTRLMIIDEISFASAATINRLNDNLNKLLRLNRFLNGYKYGGVNIVYSGDFRQLEPVRCPLGALYTTRCDIFNDWINCFIPLCGKHRFQEDPEFGDFCERMRDGIADEVDIDWINQRVVGDDGRTRDGDVVPKGIRYCTFQNRDRDAINAGLFHERCKSLYEEVGHTNDSLIIFSDNLEVRDGFNVWKTFSNRSYLAEFVGESDCKVDPFYYGRFDPALKLYQGCPVMLPYNEKVSMGLANGTQATVQSVKLKPNVIPSQVLLGGIIPVNTVNASDVLAVQCRHTDDRVETPTFNVTAQTSAFKARMNMDPGDEDNNVKISFAMKGKQVPLVVNNATTGHKLQGSSLSALYVSSWSKTQNWAYVVLSRVRTRRGLFLRKPLVYDKKQFAVPKGLIALLAEMETRKPAPIPDEDYEALQEPHENNIRNTIIRDI